MAEDKSISFRVAENIAHGAYANVASVTVNKNEVILDFAFSMPHGEQADVVSRIILSPQAAKSFLSAFQNAMLDFENHVKHTV